MSVYRYTGHIGLFVKKSENFKMIFEEKKILKQNRKKNWIAQNKKKGLYTLGWRGTGVNFFCLCGDPHTVI